MRGASASPEGDDAQAPLTLEHRQPPMIWRRVPTTVTISVTIRPIKQMGLLSMKLRTVPMLVMIHVRADVACSKKKLRVALLVASAKINYYPPYTLLFM